VAILKSQLRSRRLNNTATLFRGTQEGVAASRLSRDRLAVSFLMESERAIKGRS
jgi:hypothetical protein